ncbi:AAA family ATPase [Umezawaea beigongshangensis]|uniref:AAA family ATPase n=1 Tax=Umezawaea beigongshangensis TaxID=2780383 RepID=UPI0018F2559A|nr:AAA family ATPase [Umezawaea beigongshangensis]
MEDRGAGPGLLGRDEELRALSRLVTEARAGRGGALVVTGEAGTGTTTLLEHALPPLEGVRLLRVPGAPAERGACRSPRCTGCARRCARRWTGCPSRCARR